MPYMTEWVDNEIFTEIDGVTIYHLYRDDELESGVSSNWYSLDEDGNFDDGFEVDSDWCPADYTGQRRPTRYTSKPSAFDGSYAEWKETDEHKEIAAEWNAWHTKGREAWQIACLTNAIRTKLGPWYVAPETPEEPEYFDFRVEWVIETTATTPEEAARFALSVMRDPSSRAQTFNVNGSSVDLIGLSEGENDV